MLAEMQVIFLLWPCMNLPQPKIVCFKVPCNPRNNGKSLKQMSYIFTEEYVRLVMKREKHAMIHWVNFPDR